MPVKTYTAEPTDGGEPIEFEWEGDAPPTDADVDEILAAAGGKNPTGAGRHVDTVRPTDIHGRPIPFGSEDGGASNRFWEVAGEAFNPKTIATNVGQLLGTNTNDLINSTVANQADTFKRGWDETRKGNVTEGGPRMLAGLLPLVGPAAVRAGERIGSGDVAGGLGEGAGLVGSVVGPGAVNKAAAPLRRSVGKGMRELAIGTAGMAIKPERSYLQKMAGAGEPGGVPAVRRRALETVIDRDLLDVTPPLVSPLGRGMDRAQVGIADAQAARSAAARTGSQGPVPGSAASAERSLTESLTEAGRGSAPQQTLQQVQSFVNDARSAPRMTRVQTGPMGSTRRSLRDLSKVELEDAIGANNKELSGLYGQADMGPRAEALKNLQGSLTETFNTATGTADQAKLMRDLIDARNLMGIADTRLAAANPISATDVFSMMTPAPIPITAASVASKGGNMARIAGALGKGGRRVAAPHDVSTILRALMQSGNFPKPVSSHEE